MAESRKRKAATNEGGDDKDAEGKEEKGEKDKESKEDDADNGVKRERGWDLVAVAKRRSELMLRLWSESDRYADGPNAEGDALVALVGEGSVEAVRAFLGALASDGARSAAVRYANDKALRMAAKSAKWDCVFLLLSEYGANVHAASNRSDGLSLVPLDDAVIVHACYHGDAAIVKRLLTDWHPRRLCMDHGRAPTTTSEIDICVCKGHVDVLKCLLTHGEVGRRPLRCIRETPDAAKLAVLKLLWASWLEGVAGLESKEEAEQWTRLLQDTDDWPEAYEWVWAQCPDPARLLDLQDTLERQLIWQYEHKEYPFIDFLLGKGATLTVAMLTANLPVGSSDVTPFVRWLAERRPDLRWADFALFRKAQGCRQLRLIEWMLELPGGGQLQRDWMALRRKCDSMLCENMVADPDSSRSCAECMRRLYDSIAEYRKWRSEQAD